jgi:formylglycine-generating enzyme required for sulfatase activity
MVSIPAGSFMMGSPESEAGRVSNEGPQRRVSVPAFAAGKYEVTWAEWDRCVAAGACASLTADGFGGGSRPVTNVSWDEAVVYTTWLSSKTGQTYRLLSESEWEYGARAGMSSAYWWGVGASHEYANYGKDTCCDGLASGADKWVNTSRAGSFPANAFGLHDMNGNAAEWVEDCYAKNYSAGQTSNGSAFQQGSCSSRVARGGSWADVPRDLRSAFRSGLDPANRRRGLGFRVARTL